MSFDPASPPSTSVEQRLMERIATLERRIAALERLGYGSRELHGPRTDLAGGTGLRWRVYIDGSGNTVEQKWAVDGTPMTAAYS